METSTVFQVRNISKRFVGTVAVDNVSLSVGRGEIRALVGENGAGKSTLAKIIAGVMPASEGQMLMDTKPYFPQNILDAQSKGVAILYQEPSLIPYLTVAENIFLGTLGDFVRYGIIDWNQLYQKANRVLHEIGIDSIDPRTVVSDLTVGQRKLTELARAMSTNPDVVLVDETTAALNAMEVRLLFSNIQKLKDRGCSIIYISHRLEEIFEICDSVTVLKDGKIVETLQTLETNEDELSSLMVGRELKANSYYHRIERKISFQGPVLEVQDLSCKGKFENVSFEVHGGEILGLGGLVGSGTECILDTIFGLEKEKVGKVRVHGKEVTINNPIQAIDSNIAYVPKERDEEGLIPLFSLRENVCLTVLEKLKSKKTRLLDHQMMADLGEEYRIKLKIKAMDIDSSCLSLSGGNRQKVVLGKWLAMEPHILLLNNPTRGIDVGAKSEIYKMINELAQAGLAVVLASDELPELLGLSDRIIVMKEGKMAKSFLRNEHPTEEKLISYMI